MMSSMIRQSTNQSLRDSSVPKEDFARARARAREPLRSFSFGSRARREPRLDEANATTRLDKRK